VCTILSSVNYVHNGDSSNPPQVEIRIGQLWLPAIEWSFVDLVLVAACRDGADQKILFVLGIRISKVGPLIWVYWMVWIKKYSLY
jgi:hypothetical protein